MKERKTIMVDMDDVIVSKGFLYLINKFLNKNYIEEDFKGFYMQDIVPNKEEFFEFFLKENLYNHCELNNSVVEVLKELNEDHEVFICTSYIFPEIPDKCGIILNQKFEYLIKNFPYLNPYNFIFAGNKKIIDCDIKIDDRLDNLNGAKLKLLYTAYHNKDFDDIELERLNVIRVNNWEEVKEVIKNTKLD